MSAFQSAHFLRHQAWFQSLAAPDQEFALCHASTKRVRRGEVALASGEPPAGWHAVISGTLIMEHRSSGGPTASLAAAGPGDWLDDDLLVRQACRRHDVVAHSDAELLCLDRAAFHALLASSERFRAAVMALLAVRVEQATRLVELERTADAEERLAHCLHRWCAGDRQRVRLTQEALGRLAGTSRQTANRVLRALQRLGIVHLREGQVVRIDEDGLAQWLQARGARVMPANQGA
jgi:CRP-like cAMP-binding protein